MAAGGEFLKLPLSVSFFHFFFETFLLPNPAAPYKKGPVLSHSPPLRLDLGLSGSGPHTAQLSTLPSQRSWSPWVYHLVLIPLPETSSNQVFSVVLKPCLAGEGSINLTLSQESRGRPGWYGPGAAVALVPELVPGTFLS